MGLSRESSDYLNISEDPLPVKKLGTRLKKKGNSDLDDFMVIGIDFGTTYVYFL